jgi:hypothetical protein
MKKEIPKLFYKYSKIRLLDFERFIGLCPDIAFRLLLLSHPEAKEFFWNDADNRWQ